MQNTKYKVNAKCKIQNTKYSAGPLIAFAKQFCGAVLRAGGGFGGWFLRIIWGFRKFLLTLCH